LFRDDAGEGPPTLTLLHETSLTRITPVRPRSGSARVLEEAESNGNGADVPLDEGLVMDALQGISFVLNNEASRL
jgi:hypothetical protein